MILKATRIRTSSGAGKVGGHVLKGADNESIEVLAGSPDDLSDMVEDARDVGAKYAIRHVVISPKEAMTRAEAEAVAAAWRAEFQTGDRPWMLVEHQKKRADGNGFDRHWHMLVGEVSPSTGRVLSCRNDYARNEKLARLAELSLGHQVTAGRHNRAVVAALAAEGRAADADALRHLTVGTLPNAAYTSDSFQTAKRQGVNKAVAAVAVRAAWERSDTATAFAAALAETGLRVEQGRRRWIVVATDTAGDPIEIGSVDRLARVKAADVAARLAPPTAQEKTHVREAEGPVADRGRPRSHGREGGLGGTQDGSTHRRDADRGGEVRRPERDRADHRAPGTGDRGTAANVSAAGRHRLGACRIERGATPQILGRLDALKATAATIGKPPVVAAAASAAPAKSGGKQRVSAPSGGAGRAGGGGGGGGGGGRSMDDIIKSEHGIQSAGGGGGGGGDGAPVGDGGDPKEMAKASEAFGEAVAKLWRRFFGQASESPPSPKVSAPPPPGGGTGTGEPVHAVATARQGEPKPTADPAAELGRSLAAYLRKVNTGTLKDGQKLADAIDRRPEGRKLRQVVDAMHGDASLADFAKRLPKSSPPSEVIRRIEEEARRRQREAEQRQRERTAERIQVAKHGAQPSGPALRMGR